MAYNDVVNAISNAITDANTLENVINGAPNIQFKSRLGRYIWTLATIGYKIELVNQQANAATSAIEAHKTLTTQTANAAMFDINSARDNVQNLLDAKLNDMDNAIDSVAAVKSQENGWTALLVADSSGMTQQQVNDKTALFYNTVAEMVADTKLKAGKAVITHGYYTPNDGGGARYLIKDTATDYSIPVANNLHAVFADSFDIRKFGIRNNSTLDQTTEIQRMVNYADSRIYEIDFLGYSLMTPKTIHPTAFGYTDEYPVRGMRFKRVHHLKNLTIANDKTVKLKHGTSLILFAPDLPNGSGLFKLSNIKFDPYVSDFEIGGGHADGHMLGFGLDWDNTAGITWDVAGHLQTNYDLEFDNVEFLSPAVSYNIHSQVYTNNMIIRNCRGQYWGLFVNHHSKNLYVDNLNGVFRDDLHGGSGRVLVTNLIHEEPELYYADRPIYRGDIIVKDSSCIKYTNGDEYVLYHCELKGDTTINRFIANKNIGAVTFYGGATPELIALLKINYAEVSDVGYCHSSFVATVKELVFKNIKTLDAPVLAGLAKFGSLTIDNVGEIKNALCVGGDATCENLTIRNVSKVVQQPFGIIRGSAKVKNITLENVTANIDKLIDCAFELLTLNNVKTNVTSFNYFIQCTANTVFNPAIVNIIDSAVIADRSYFIFLNNDNSVINIINSYISSNHLYSVTPNLKQNTVVETSLTYDPPKLSGGGNAFLDVTLDGVKSGDAIAASFSVYSDNLNIDARVVSDNHVGVYFRNIGTFDIDLNSGILKVKRL